MYNFIPEIMYKAAEIMLSAHNIDSKIEVKPGDANFVTAYDKAVEEFLITELTKQLPEAYVIGEEEEENPTDMLSKGLSLIIDPIDGTTNFIHRYRHSAISVGLCDRGVMIYGAVYDPYMDLLYTAEREKGAYITEKKSEKSPLHINDKPLKDSLAAFGTSPYRRNELGKITFDTAYKMFLHTRDIRRSGSAALDLASVAAGVVDIFFEYSLSPWDFAAGSILVEEAGGIITDMTGKKLTFDSPSSILCGNKRAHEEWLNLNK